MDQFTVNLVYYRQLLKQASLGSLNIGSVEEIDAAINIFTSIIKSARNTSKLYHTCPHRDSTIPDLEELLQRKSKARKIMHNFKRAADRRLYSFLNNCIHRRLKRSKIQIFGKDIEDTSASRPSHSSGG
jgi:hypothetical protein